MEMGGMAKTIEALERGVDVLEILGERGSVRLAELPGLLNVSRATAFRLLTTLQQRGYVERLPDQRGYRLGAGAVILASAAQANTLVALTAPAMEDLLARTGETVNLALWRGRRLVYAEVLDGVFALRMSGTIGQLAPLHSTALGKAILAWLSPDERHALLGEEPFRSYTNRTLTTWSALDAELAGVLYRGFAVEVEEMDIGAACIGAPVLNRQGRPVAAVSVSGFIARLGEKERAVNGELLVEWCRRISHALGYGDEEASPWTQAVDVYGATGGPHAGHPPTAEPPRA
jgi:DNA-binding IclR family transcriptional regulator